jgi:hypothetical protein
VDGCWGGVVFGPGLACSASLAPFVVLLGDSSAEALSSAWSPGVGRRNTASRIDCDLAFFLTSAFCSSQAA